MITIE